MSDYINLGAFMRIVDVHWESGRFLEREEYMTPYEDLFGVNFNFGYFTTTTPQEFIAGNYGVSADGMNYVSTQGLQYDRFDPPGYWVIEAYGFTHEGWADGARPVWHQPWPVMSVHIPFDGFVRTRAYPYDTDSNGNIVGWLDLDRAAHLSARYQVFTGDILYSVHNVSAEGAGSYVGMPMYLLRTKTGFIANGITINTNQGMSLYSAGRKIFIAKGAVQVKGDETTSEDIYQLKDFSEPYLTVGDVTTDTVDNCSASLYVFDNDKRETMLAYNGNGGCTGKMPLTYAQVCSIGGIKLSFAATACIDQPTYSNPDDLVITALTIRTQEVTHA